MDTDTLDWDLNGNLTDGITTSMIWNWDNRLRSAAVGSDNISCRYAPDGSMVYKKTTIDDEDTERKFIVDIVGKYPVILMELNPANDNEIKKTYIHANGQVLMHHDSDSSADKFFYLHDRLGSVRHLIGPDGIVFWYDGTEAHYTYDPFGNHLESDTIGDTTSRFRFAGYKWDNTIGMYNCNARWYAPAISRFTGRDPVKGKFQEPLTLHKYLYCGNNPINYTDLDGRWAIVLGGSLTFNSGEAASATVAAMDTVGNIFGGGAFGQALSAATGLATHNAYTALGIDILGGNTGGTAGVGAVIGYGKDEGLFGGLIGWAAGGVGVGVNLAATADLAFSPNAQNMSDLSGGFIEAGGSGTWPVTFGPFMNLTIGGSVSRGINNDIYLITGSIGGGVAPGAEAHGFVGHTWVLEEW